jgi:tol-pal system protein YbgF
LALSLRGPAPRAFLALCFALVAGLLTPCLALAQNANEAQLVGRVQDLEQQVRDLTGQVQGLQFTLTQMQQQLQKMADDNEFRFQQLEGGGGKKPPAKMSNATPTNVAPQGQTSSAAANDTTAGAPPPAPLGTGKTTSSTTAKSADTGGQPSDGLGDSHDPLLGKGGTQSQATLGTLPAGQDGKGLDLNLKSSEAISNGDAEAQYKAGYDAITRGDYAFAADQFKQFIALYPKDPAAADATNWLGEALLQQQAYDDAADVLLTGYQNYQNSPRAPDLLLKLGIALAGAGEQDTACRTFFEVAKRYPKQPQAFLQRLQDEKAKANCPV